MYLAGIQPLSKVKISLVKEVCKVSDKNIIEEDIFERKLIGELRAISQRIDELHASEYTVFCNRLPPLHNPLKDWIPD